MVAIMTRKVKQKRYSSKRQNGKVYVKKYWTGSGR